LLLAPKGSYIYARVVVSGRSHNARVLCARAYFTCGIEFLRLLRRRRLIKGAVVGGVSESNTSLK